MRKTQDTIAIATMFVIALIFVFFWAVEHISLKAMLFYMKSKGYAPPSKTETKKWCKYAAKHSFGLVEDLPD